MLHRKLTLCFMIHFAAYGAVHSQEIKRIRIGYPAISTTQSHIWVGHEAGLFRKYGIDAEPVFLRGGQIATQALAGGDPPIVNIGTVVQANLQGYNLALVAAVQSKYDFYVFSRPEITRLEQIKGKRVGITGFGSATHNASTILLRHLKLEPNKDAAIVPSGVESEQIAALISGKIDLALFTSIVAYRARKAGLHELFYIGDLNFEVQGNGLATSRSYIQSHREVVNAVVKGYVEAIHYIIANKKEAQRIFAKYLRNDDPEFLDFAHQLYVKLIPKRPYPTLKGIQNLLDILAPQLPQAKSAKPDQFVDLSFLQELEKEGFFNEMAKRYPSK
jgi:NitT/TauT family transport system substrate-binding protein